MSGGFSVKFGTCPIRDWTDDACWSDLCPTWDKILSRLRGITMEGGGQKQWLVAKAKFIPEGVPLPHATNRMKAKVLTGSRWANSFEI